MDTALTPQPSSDAGPLLASFRDDFDLHLHKQFPGDDRLSQAMRYAATGPGKRVRPFLVARCAELAGAVADAWRNPAIAIECVHAFSLVHDDLPAMDDDDQRRGRPTVHRAFDEATAILAGDALLALAFELLADAPGPPQRRVDMCAELARATGKDGMIGGQMADCTAVDPHAGLEEIHRIHGMKTARLFEAACRLGGLAGDADDRQLFQLARFGRTIGLAFQIVDDVLDAGGGHTESDKLTYPRCVGLEESRQAAAALIEESVAIFDESGPQAEPLRILARYVGTRTY